jgi:hypothetical protein
MFDRVLPLYAWLYPKKNLHRSKKMAKSSKSSDLLGSFVLTGPALTTLVAYALLIALVMLPFNMYAYDGKEGKYVTYKYSFTQRLALSVLLLLPFLLGIYSVNCMMVGNCVLFSWIVAAITILWAIIVVILALMNNGFVLEDVLYA